MENESGRGSGKRVSRACIRCRSRKSRCDLDSVGAPESPPCQKCVKDKQECVLGSSNRGGWRLRKPKVPLPLVSEAVPALQASPTTSTVARRFSIHEPTPSVDRLVSLTSMVSNGCAQDVDIQDDNSVSDGDDPITETNLRNPSDAWQFLQNVANAGRHDRGGAHKDTASVNGYGKGGANAVDGYRLVEDGSLSVALVTQLVTK